MALQSPLTMKSFRLLLEEFLMLLDESCSYHHDPIMKAVLREALSLGGRIYRRLQFARQRFVVALVGQTNVGKSTLLAALLGEEISPRRNGPCTATPIEFSYGHRLQMKPTYSQSLRQSVFTFDSTEELNLQLALLVDESQVAPHERPDRVEVFIPLPLLKDGLIIADTPGFSAAELGDDRSGCHEECLLNYLNTQVSQAVWIVLGDQGIGRREFDFYHQHLANVCDDLIVTGCDDWTLKDKQRFEQRFSTEFQLHVPRFHFVSGRMGLLAQQTDDEASFAESGIREVSQRILHLADPTARGRQLAHELLDLSQRLGKWLCEQNPSPETPWWRPDSWSRWLTTPTGLFKTQINAALTQR